MKNQGELKRHGRDIYKSGTRHVATKKIDTPAIIEEEDDAKDSHSLTLKA
jgi:hypothetical protein